MSTQNYLENIRSSSHYPVYRRVIKVLTIFSHIASVFLIVVGVAAVAHGKDESVATGIGMIVASLFLIFVFIPFQKEISLMFVDLVDSTLDKNSRS